MRLRRTSAASRPAESHGPLDWENLGAHPTGRAFWRTLKQLVFSQNTFFGRMATTGGLREPLMFMWLLLTAAIVMSLPLTLSHFALTAPDPASVSVETYNLHLLAPRVAGFLTTLLPFTLCVAGVLVVTGGTGFHLGAKFFGARNWEGSVSIWCYAKSAAFAPVVAAEAAVCAVSVLGWLLALAWPASKETAGMVAHWSIMVLGCGAALCSVALFFAGVLHGCTRSFNLEPAEGAAAALAGVLAISLPGGLVGFGFYQWGAKGGATCAVTAVLIVIVMLVAHRFAAQPARPERPHGRVPP